MPPRAYQCGICEISDRRDEHPVLYSRPSESSEVLPGGGGPAPWTFKRRAVTDRVGVPQGNTHSMGSESRQGLSIHRLVSHRVIDKHPGTGRRSIGKGRLPKLGYKVEVVSDLAQSRMRKPDGRARSSGLRPAPACDRSPTSCPETKTAPQKRNVPLLQDRYFGCASKLLPHTGQTPARERWPHRDLHNKHASCSRSSSRSGISGRAHRHRLLKPPRYVLLYRRASCRGRSSRFAASRAAVNLRTVSAMESNVRGERSTFSAVCKLPIAIRSQRPDFHETPCKHD